MTKGTQKEELEVTRSWLRVEIANVFAFFSLSLIHVTISGLCIYLEIINMLLTFAEELSCQSLY
jgi:hypothetical protein